MLNGNILVIDGSLLTNKQLDVYIRHVVSCCRVFDLQTKRKYTKE